METPSSSSGSDRTRGVSVGVEARSVSEGGSAGPVFAVQGFGAENPSVIEKDGLGASIRREAERKPAVHQRRNMKAETRSTMDDERHVLYPVARAVLLVVVGIVGMNVCTVGRAQSQASDRPVSEPKWRLVLDGDRDSWPGQRPSVPLDSIRAVGRTVVEKLRRNGYYYAQVDSAVVDTTSARVEVQVYAQRGPRVTIGNLQIVGAEAVPRAELRRLMDTREGGILDPRRLEADLQAVMDRYEEAGRPLVQIQVEETRIDTASSPRLQVTLHVNEGPSLWLKRIDVPDDARTSPGLVARLAHLARGDSLRNYDPEDVRESLEESSLFQSVEAPELQVEADGGAILHVPVEEASPGAFDLALGYLPPSDGREEGQLVGSGHLLLEHLFGGGRRIDLKLDRRPGQTSLFDLSVSDPYIFGMPFRVTGEFQGEQRDSTYGERTYGLDAGYEVGEAFEVTGGVSREVLNPGSAGARLRGERQRIPRARTLFYGLGLRYEAVDRVVNPRRGLRLDVEMEQGYKRRTFQQVVAEGDTTREQQSLRQERLRGTMRFFVPIFDRQVFVAGGDGAVLRSRDYDRGDLFRMGGAESLRGYDEDRFLGNVTVRGLLEYRLQLDRRSYAYVFGDVGYVERPALADSRAMTSWHPGYGVGLQLGTELGLITTSYALNPEAGGPAGGRIHFGLSVGL